MRCAVARNEVQDARGVLRDERPPPAYVAAIVCLLPAKMMLHCLIFDADALFADIRLPLD